MPRRLALVHDYLTQRGGAERVVAEWCRGFANAPLYTALFDPDGTFPSFSEHEVIASPLNNFATLRHHHRLALPLLAPVMSTWRIDADVVLASSSGWAHGVRTDGRLVVYCHAPARWLYQRERYLSGGLGHHARLAAAALSSTLEAWDQRAARRVDTYVANSTFTARLIERVYGITAEVVPPPVGLSGSLREWPDEADVLVVARLLPYKNVDIAVAVARLMPDARFVVAGDGPLRADLERTAPPNVTFTGSVGDERLWQLYSSSRVHLALSHEDFGLTPIEAAAAGRPTVARSFGGYLDTITADSGVLIPDEEVSPESVRAALSGALSRDWDRTALREHARTFSPEAHLTRLRAILRVD